MVKRFLLSFVYAGRGLWHCLRNERSFRVHLVAAAYAMTLAAAISVSAAEWAILFLTVALVISAEAVNTAVENAVDLNGKNPHPLSRVAKDAAAGAVLLCAAAAIAVGVILFWKPNELTVLWLQIKGNLWKLSLLALSLPLSMLFIFMCGTEKKISTN